jgi:predicted RNA-binding Zn ribbon-like protein
MDERTTYINSLNLVGGRLCLDYANTVGTHNTEHSDERLASYQDLLVWSRHAGLLDDGRLEQLGQIATAHPAEAQGTFEQAYSLRETIYRIFSAVAGNRPAATDDLDQFNRALRSVMSHSILVQTGQGFAWDWEPAENALDSVLWPIVRSAADLLVSGDLGRVRECSSDSCEWLFVDTSRNRSRRWCDMEDCGNRAKARRHYHRKRAAEQPEA